VQRASEAPPAEESPFAPLAAPAAPAPSRRRGATPAKRRRAHWAAWVAAAGLVAVGLLSLVVLTSRTAGGKVVVEIDQKDAQVFVDGKRITTQVPGDMKPIEITVGEGKHELLVQKDGFESVTREFSYRKGQAEPIRVTLKPTVVSPPEALTNSVGMRLVRIPAGKFRMGSTEQERKGVLALPKEAKLPDWLAAEGPRHEVAITRPFYLGAYEVTQQEYEKVMGKNPSHFAATGDGKEAVRGLDTRRFPVERVSYDEAVAFCRKLTASDTKKPAGHEYRLPTEAEWEYACRGGASTYQTFHFGNSLSSTQANFDGRHPYGGADEGDYLKRTTRVGSYSKNGFGLYDLHGNVWEWCLDCYDPGYYARSPGADPRGPSEGSDRVIRGGSWDYDGQYCRSAKRDVRSPGYRDGNLGFRVALIPSGK
jgi:formylglycine-generating enzyme required for sulfatase activity